MTPWRVSCCSSHFCLCVFIRDLGGICPFTFVCWTCWPVHLWTPWQQRWNCWTCIVKANPVTSLSQTQGVERRGFSLAAAAALAVCSAERRDWGWGRESMRESWGMRAMLLLVERECLSVASSDNSTSARVQLLREQSTGSAGGWALNDTLEKTGTRRWRRKETEYIRARWQEEKGEKVNWSASDCGSGAAETFLGSSSLWSNLAQHQAT